MKISCGSQSQGRMLIDGDDSCLLFLPDVSQKCTIVLAYGVRFFESARAFSIQTLKVALNVLDVALEILSDQISIFDRRHRVTRNKGPLRRETGGAAG
jgi:hypothetical protein